MVFEMIGKISLGKETEKFKPYSEHTYDSGWVKRKIMFNAICGDNRHLLTVDAGSFADGHGDVYTFSKGSVDDNGNKVKGESLKIPFKDRLTSPKLAEVAEFKKFIFDLEKPNRRYKLEKAAEKVKEGTSLTDEELKELGIESEADINNALEKSNKKRHEFISEWDFAEFIKKVIDSGKYSDKKFYIKGNANYSYSDNKKQVYESYIPQRIYLADDDANEYSTAMGYSTTCDGVAATTLGSSSYANGWGAMSSGIATKAYGMGQHVFGAYNIPDENIDNYSLDDIEAKLAVICVRNKVNFK